MSSVPVHEVDVLVIGAGPTGIGAAVRLQEHGADWLLVEASDGPGGMAGSVHDEHGFTWDLGGHVLHSHFPDFDRAIAETGIELLHPVRNGWVWLDGQLLRTPIQHQLDVLPTDLDPDGPVGSLDDYYLHQFGAQLHRTFFKPYTEKMWATPLERVDHRWTSLRSGSAARNVPAMRLRRADEPAAAPVSFPYPAGGNGVIWDAIAARLDAHRLRYGARVEAVDLEQRTARLGTGEVIRFGECVSSMPITTLLASVGRPDLAETATELLCNSTLVVGLGYDGPAPAALAEKTWLYCPDRDIAWHRATVLSNYDPANAGEGRWSVLCEVGRSAFREIPDDDAVRSCISTMSDLGADRDRLVSTWVRQVPMGYPVPTQGRDELLRKIDDVLVPAGIRSRGRFGGWRYESCNQDYSFQQGIEAVEAFRTGAAEDVYWRPELFS